MKSRRLVPPAFDVRLSRARVALVKVRTGVPRFA
jgi:hypothetical protein